VQDRGSVAACLVPDAQKNVPGLLPATQRSAP
jgi:hypothetical protein